MNWILESPVMRTATQQNPYKQVCLASLCIETYFHAPRQHFRHLQFSLATLPTIKLPYSLLSLGSLVFHLLKSCILIMGNSLGWQIVAILPHQHQNTFPSFHTRVLDRFKSHDTPIAWFKYTRERLYLFLQLQLVISSLEGDNPPVYLNVFSSLPQLTMLTSHIRTSHCCPFIFTSATHFSSSWSACRPFHIPCSPVPFKLTGTSYTSLVRVKYKPTSSCISSIISAHLCPLDFATLRSSQNMYLYHMRRLSVTSGLILQSSSGIRLPYTSRSAKQEYRSNCRTSETNKNHGGWSRAASTYATLSSTTTRNREQSSRNRRLVSRCYTLLLGQFCIYRELRSLIFQKFGVLVKWQVFGLHGEVWVSIH